MDSFSGWPAPPADLLWVPRRAALQGLGRKALKRMIRTLERELAGLDPARRVNLPEPGLDLPEVSVRRGGLDYLRKPAEVDAAPRTGLDAPSVQGHREAVDGLYGGLERQSSD